ncbi:MAG TPA: hypothetical protein VJ934_03610 [Desulfomicrobiaceae bacterium]|nr:hypothetical protein [Desulfomicrobiaceae bacterium]
MRRFRWLLIPVLLGAAVMAVFSYSPWLKDLLQEIQALRTGPGKMAESRISLCYVLSFREWTTFTVPAAATHVKVVSNGDRIVPDGEEEIVAESDPLAYGLEWEVLDRDAGTVLDEGISHHASRLTLYDPPGRGGPEPAAFYADTGAVPLDGRVVRLDLNGLRASDPPGAIRFRLAGKAVEIEDVVIRVYFREPNPEQELDRLWRRLPVRTREGLARASVYSRDLLSPQEKRNLVRWSWKPGGPRGIPEQDYRLRRMYVRRDLDAFEVMEPPEPTGLRAGPGLRATMVLPEEGRDLQLRFTADDPGGDNATVEVRWYGTRLKERSSFSVPLQRGGGMERRFFKGGLLEFRAPVPVRIRAVEVVDGEPEELLPDLLYTRTFTTAPNPVRYRLTPHREQSQPVRLDFRIPLGLDADPAREKQVRVELLDGEGNTVRTRTVSVHGVPSLYDRVSGGEPECVPSDPVSVYLQVSSSVAALRISSDRPLLVNGFSRPAGMMRRVQVPEDFYRSPEQREVRLPVWFPLYPEHVRKLYGTPASKLLTVQYRPPEDDPDLVAERYAWESFRPRGTARGRRLVVDSEQTRTVRADSLGARFYPLSAWERSLRLQKGRTGSRVSPTLLYVRSGAGPLRIRVDVDGRKFFEREVAAGAGTVRLPVLSAGTHRFRATSSGPAELYMNSVASTAPGRLLRFGYVLDRPLTFDVLKRTRGEELVTLQFYSGGRERSEIEVSLAGNGPAANELLADYTTRRRVFDVRPGPGSVPVLASGGGRLGQGRRLFVPLGADLPPGRYSLTVRLRTGPSGVVVPYRVVPGARSKRSVYTEELGDGS